MSFGSAIKKRLKNLIACSIMAFAIAPVLLETGAAQAQDTRYTNNQYGISFQPPSEWTPDILTRYLGPRRDDGTQPTLNLVAHSYTMTLNDQETNALTDEMLDQLESQGMREARVADRRKTTISGLEALQIDLTYKERAVPMRLRQIYVPVVEHKRTYLFTFIDTAQHFAKSASAVDSAVASFTPAITRDSTGGTQSPADTQANSYTLLLVIIGFIALLAIIGAAYLLLRRQTARR